MLGVNIRVHSMSGVTGLGKERVWDTSMCRLCALGCVGHTFTAHSSHLGKTVVCYLKDTRDDRADGGHVDPLKV